LISILLPSLQNAREIAKSVLCSNNLRQIGIGAEMYAEDFNRRTTSYLSKPGDMTGSKAFWTDMLLPYVGESTGVFECPSELGGWRPHDRGHFGSYGVNITHTTTPTAGAPEEWGSAAKFVYVYRPFTQIEFPWLSMAIMDSQGPTPGYSKLWVRRLTTTTFDGITDIHKGSTNVAFFDGHVTSMDTELDLADPNRPWAPFWNAGL